MTLLEILKVENFFWLNSRNWGFFYNPWVLGNASFKGHVFYSVRCGQNPWTTLYPSLFRTLTLSKRRKKKKEKKRKISMRNHFILFMDDS